MGKVEAPRRTHSVYWRGSQYPYSTCHAAGGLAQQARRAPAYHVGGGNGVPRVGGRASGVDSIWQAFSERVRSSSGRNLARTSSSSSNMSSPTGSLGSPTMAAATLTRLPSAPEDDGKPLKRLAFVRAQGSFWLTWMSHAYCTGRALVPLPHGVIDALETTMSDISSTLVSAASEHSEKVLYSLDSKVDNVVSMATRVCDSATTDAWESLAQRPPFKFVLTAYQQAHDAVVATPIYTKALEIGSETMAKVHDSRLYKSLLPLVGPLTEPTVKRIMDSPTFQAVKEHLAPMPPPGETAHMDVTQAV